MSRVNLIVPIGADQQQMVHVRLDQYILQEVQCRCVQPLQIIEKQCQWMLRARKYADESSKYLLEASLSVLRREIGNRWLFANNQLQFRKQVHDELSVCLQRITKGFAPITQLSFALG